MFGNSGPTLGYASAAVLVCLMKKLISDGTITKDEAAEILDDAAEFLNVSGGGVSIEAAIKLIRNEMRAKIAA